jgi:predicted metal-dependent hydrolase
MQEDAITYGKEVIRYRVVERPRRRTLGIEVHPDGTVVVLKPSECGAELVTEKVTKRANWISQKLAYFLQYAHSAPPRHYLSGESHRYLGRQYRLRVTGTTNGSASITLTRNELIICQSERPTVQRTKKLLEQWYLERSKTLFAVVLQKNFRPFQKLGLSQPRLLVRPMRTRWGSLSRNGQMTLNVRLVQAPKLCIEYVVVHELCHLIHSDHSPAFWRLLNRVMPDWEERKRRLEGALLN